MSDRIKVLLVEDDQDFAFLIQKIIRKDTTLELLGHADSREAGVEMACMLKPDIVVMDLNLSGRDLDGIETSREIRLKTDAKVLLLTSYEQSEIIINASKRAFASGYVFKSQCQNLADTINKTATTHTPQEQFIKELIRSDLTSAERSVLDDLLDDRIDTLSSSSLKTIANQKTSIFKKLGLRNTGELIQLFKSW
jgi:DNA-binding NarL/FixJ family response regulator